MRFAVWLFADPTRPLNGPRPLHGDTPIRLRDRFRARLRAQRLDRRLAAGEPAAGSPVLEHRARLLMRTSSRAGIAAGLRHVARGDTRSATLGNRLRPVGGIAASAAAEMNQLADRIDGAGPVDVRLLAAARQLLSDGSGPLYRRRVGERPGERVTETFAPAEVAR